jgi:hypothetical protein
MQWAAHPFCTLIQDMGVDHRGAQLLMPGEHSDAILLPFPISAHALPAAKIDILYPSMDTFHQAQAGAIEQTGHEPW